MKQNEQYLYEYKNGRRIRNIGFLKMEKMMDKCVVQIYGSELDQVKGILFEREGGGEYMGSWAEEISDSEEGSRRKDDFDIEEMSEPEAEVEVEEYIAPRNITYEKIQRQNLSRLPRREWRIANNSFLLHGFYNYHHLLYIEEEGKIWIGVPGIFHEKEQVAANAFGFTEFRRITDVEVQLSEEEKNTYDDFGYWCRQIPIS